MISPSLIMSDFVVALLDPHVEKSVGKITTIEQINNIYFILMIILFSH